MAKLTNQEIADQVFEKSPKVDKVFVCGGYTFLNQNSAELYKNTSGKKDLKVFSFDRKEPTVKVEAAAEPKPVKLDKLNKADLIAAAELKGIRPEETNTKAEIIAMIEAVDNAEIIE
jgi:hypothetical protein